MRLLLDENILISEPVRGRRALLYASAYLCTVDAWISLSRTESSLRLWKVQSSACWPK
jgi:hypothetical protein